MANGRFEKKEKKTSSVVIRNNSYVRTFTRMTVIVTWSTARFASCITSFTGMRYLAVEHPLWAFRDTCRAHEMFCRSARETLVTSVTIACLARWATWHATVNGKINRSKGHWDRLATLKSHLFNLPVSFTRFPLRFRGSFNVIFQSLCSGNCSVGILSQKATDKKTKIGCWQLSRRNSPITTSRDEIVASLRARFELRLNTAHQDITLLIAALLRNVHQPI